jgi:hypothetical protein
MRFLPVWNVLPDDVVCARSTDCFKTKLENLNLFDYVKLRYV